MQKKFNVCAMYFSSLAAYSMDVTYFFVTVCNKTGVINVKSATMKYVDTIIGTLPVETISLYNTGWASNPTTLDDSEKT